MENQRIQELGAQEAERDFLYWEGLMPTFTPSIEGFERLETSLERKPSAKERETFNKAYEKRAHELAPPDLENVRTKRKAEGLPIPEPWPFP